METLAQRIERHEGRRPYLYYDTLGNPSIGVGRNLRRGLRQDEIDLMRDNDVRQASIDLAHALPWTSQLDALRREVLVEMVFNIGVEKLLTFKKMLSACAAGDYVTASAEMKASLWAGQVGARATELAAIMQSGVA